MELAVAVGVAVGVGVGVADAVTVGLELHPLQKTKPAIKNVKNNKMRK